MKVYVNELSNEELEKVYKANNKLNNLIGDSNYQMEMEYAIDIIHCFDKHCIDYCLGYDRGTFVRCLHESDFIDGCIKAQEEYCIFSDEDYKQVETALDLYSIVGKLDAYGIDSDNVENAITVICNSLADIMDSFFTKAFETALFDEAYGIATLIDFYADEWLTDCYINDEDGDYILYHDITESFK